MRLTHAESGRELAGRASEARSYWQRFRGLMLRPALGPGEGLLIAPCSSIHMMFMRFSIDAVFYDRSGRVTKVARNLHPWIGMALGGRGAHGVIELPRGAAEGITKGDHIAELMPGEERAAA
jgi:uncharacterized membrane protein (UPF0127 family)